MKKVLPLLCVATLTSALITNSSASAQGLIIDQNQEQDSVSLESRIEQLENTIYELSNRPQYITRQSRGPAPGLVGEGQPGWFISAEYLYWSPRNLGFEYGITDIGGVQDRGAVGQVLQTGGAYQGGFRGTIGHRLGDWMGGGPELLFTYTDLNAAAREVYAGPLRATVVSADNSENNDADDINTLGVETITPDDRATGAVAIQSLRYNVVDAMFAQNLVMTDTLVLRLTGGGRYAEIDQDKRVTYTGGDFQTAFTSFQNSDYRGGGVLSGLETQWYLTDRLHFNVGLTGGLMLGDVRTRTFIPDDEPGVPTDVRYSETRLTPMVEMLAGIEYSVDFGCASFDIGAGYQFVNWFDMVDDRSFYESHQEGTNAHVMSDLTLDGFVGHVGLTF